MDGSRNKQEILQSLVIDEMVHDSVGSDWTDSAPSCSGTDAEGATELKPGGSMDSPAQLGMTDEIQNENMEKYSIEPSPRMISNLIVITPQDDNFDKCEIFQTNTGPYSPDHQEIINQETPTPTVEQELMDVVIKEEITDDVSNKEMYDKRVRGEIQNCEESIKLEDDINYNRDDKLREKVNTGAQPVIMKNETSEDRLQELLIKSESIFKESTQMQLCAPDLPDFSPEGMGIILTDNGVWSTRFLPKGTEFGLNDHRAVPSDSFADEWISYLRKSTGDIGHNMVAKLLGSKIFYKLLTDIQPKTELILLELEPTYNIGERDTDTSVATKQKQSGTKSHQCIECGKKFIRKADLAKHILIHSGEKTHECIQCGKTFTQKCSLGRHMLTHSGKKEHECIECGKHFTLKHTLVTHMLTHSGEKPHKCEQCGKLFSLSGNLKKHMKIHTEVKLFQCFECGKQFTQRRYLERHVLTHSGEKQHDCKQCGKTFTLKGYLEKHLLRHSVEKSHQCIECGKLFSQSGRLKTHMKSHIPVKNLISV